MQEIKYVYDEDGRKTEVIVPIRMWSELAHIKKESKHLNLARYRGIYKNMNINPKKEAKELRKEWGRV